MEEETQARPTYRITDLETTERPRERLARIGAKSLSQAELIAILLRTGIPGENAVQVGQRLLKDMGGLVGIQRATYNDVCRQKGVGPAKAAQIKAAIELGRRLSLEGPQELPVIHTPQDAANQVLYEMSALEHEELRVLLLNQRNQVTDIIEVYRGSLNSSQVRVAEIFTEAVRNKVASIIVVHNHPSGDPSPSAEDIAITRAIVQAGQLLDIPVLDHLIIAGGRFVSLKERGLGFS